MSGEATVLNGPGVTGPYTVTAIPSTGPAGKVTVTCETPLCGLTQLEPATEYLVTASGIAIATGKCTPASEPVELTTPPARWVAALFGQSNQVEFQGEASHASGPSCCSAPALRMELTSPTTAMAIVDPSSGAAPFIVVAVPLSCSGAPSRARNAVAGGAFSSGD